MKKPFFGFEKSYWYISKKARTEARENTYAMTMINREPRQIVSFDIQFDKYSFRYEVLRIMLFNTIFP